MISKMSLSTLLVVTLFATAHANWDPDYEYHRKKAEELRGSSGPIASYKTIQPSHQFASVGPSVSPYIGKPALNYGSLNNGYVSQQLIHAYGAAPKYESLGSYASGPALKYASQSGGSSYGGSYSQSYSQKYQSAPVASSYSTLGAGYSYGAPAQKFQAAPAVSSYSTLGGGYNYEAPVQKFQTGNAASSYSTLGGGYGYGAQVQKYQSAPVVSSYSSAGGAYSYGNAQAQKYSAPLVVKSVVAAPSYASYAQPQSLSYSSGLSSQSYSAGSSYAVAPLKIQQAYVAPKLQYGAPVVHQVAAPLVAAHIAAPLVSSYSHGGHYAAAPVVSSYSNGGHYAAAPVVSSYSNGGHYAAAPVVSSYSNAGHYAAAPVVSSYSNGGHYAAAPLVSSYSSGGHYAAGPVVASYPSGGHYAAAPVAAHYVTPVAHKVVAAPIKYSSAHDVSSQFISVPVKVAQLKQVVASHHAAPALVSYAAGPAHVASYQPAPVASIVQYGNAGQYGNVAHAQQGHGIAVQQVAPVYKVATSGKATNVHEEYLKNYDDHPKYSFEYGVNDPHTGDNHHQKESRDGDVVTGVYSLVEPDGSTRTVEYTADWETGFHAKVHKSEPTRKVLAQPVPVLAKLG